MYVLYKHVADKNTHPTNNMVRWTFSTFQITFERGLYFSDAALGSLHTRLFFVGVFIVLKNE